MKKTTLTLLLLTFLVVPACTTPQDIQETNTSYEYTTLYEDLDSPWGITFVSDNEALITQKEGTLIHLDIEEQETTRIEGVPDVADVGQGGLLDVHYDQGYVYITYSASQNGEHATHLARGQLQNTTINFETLHVATPFTDGGSHFGSRVITQDDYVYYTTGDRGSKDFSENHASQDTESYLGKTIRLYKNGSTPQTNPFIDNESVHDAIYTYGHRNTQGITIHPETQEIWTSEHGERDGDKLNILRAGNNYGWPIAHSGCMYGTRIQVSDSEFEKEHVENPVYVWECTTGGFPPSGMTFYTGERDEFNQELFVGNLAGQHLGRFSLQNGELIQKTPLLKDLEQRIRDVEQSPDGKLYVITDSGWFIHIT